MECVFDKFPKCHMEILLGDFNAKVDMEDIFKSTMRNESLREISNDNGVRVVNFITCKTHTVKSRLFSHCNVHKLTWTSHNGKTQNQIDHNFIGDDIQVYLMTYHSGSRL
jgi:hypothetical protein